MYRKLRFVTQAVNNVHEYEINIQVLLSMYRFVKKKERKRKNYQPNKQWMQRKH